MARKLKLLTATVMGIGLFAGLVLTAGAAEFFKGKTITFVVGFSAGGGFDIYTRLIGRHIGKHIPGNPTIVVQNRTGAGSLIAANYIYEQNEMGRLSETGLAPWSFSTYWVIRVSSSTAGSSAGLVYLRRIAPSVPSSRRAALRPWMTGSLPSGRLKSGLPGRVQQQTMARNS